MLWSWGQTYLTLNEPAIAPVGDSLPNAEIFRRLAGRMGFDDPAFVTGDEELVAASLAPLGHLRTRELRQRGWIRLDTEEHVLPYAAGGFATPSARCELFSQRLADAGMDPLPDFQPAAESPAGDPGLAARFPLALLTAKGAHHFLNSSYGNVERAVKAEKTPLLDMHPADRGTRISDGDRVACSTTGDPPDLARVGERCDRRRSLRRGGGPAITIQSPANALTPDGLSDLGAGGDTTAPSCR